MFLLDTNVISEMIKKKPDSRIMHKLELHQNEIVTAAPVWHELNFGCNRLSMSKKRKRIETFLQEIISQSLEILPYDKKAAAWHAGERARLSAKGLTPPFVDGQIASIAFVNNLTLVTRNSRDFEFFSNLSVESWHLSY